MPETGPLDTVDTLPGAIVGYRAMLVDRGGYHPAGLYPVAISKEPWVSGVNKAKCKKGMDAASIPHGSERVPVEWCSCGFWAFKKLKELKDAGFDAYGFPVNCIIAGWGKIVEHEIGFRCEYARPLAIIEPLERGVTREELAPFSIPVVSIAEVPTIIEGFQLDALRVEEAEEEKIPVDDSMFTSHALRMIQWQPWASGPKPLDPKNFVKGNIW